MRSVVELPLVKIPIIYPESDGTPMGETEWHVFLMAKLLGVLEQRFRSRIDVHVGGNLFIYFKEGDPTEVICPDVFVAFGAKPGRRRTWKTWEEGGLFPQFIIELVSTDSRNRDLTSKRGFYGGMGVGEYFVFDPSGEALDPPRLRGWRRRADGDLAPVAPERRIPMTLRSEMLGLMLVEEGERIRLVDAKTGARLPFPEEEAEARQKEAEARQSAERELARLRDELSRLKDKQRPRGRTARGRRGRRPDPLDPLTQASPSPKLAHVVASATKQTETIRRNKRGNYGKVRKAKLRKRGSTRSAAELFAPKTGMAKP